MEVEVVIAKVQWPRPAKQSQAPHEPEVSGALMRRCSIYTLL